MHWCFFLRSCSNYNTMSLRQVTINYQYPLYQTALAFMLLWGIKGSFLFGNKACGHLTENFSIADSPMVSYVEKSSLDLEHSAVLMSTSFPCSLFPRREGRKMRADLGNKVALYVIIKKSSFESEKKKIKKRLWALNTMSVWSS